MKTPERKLAVIMFADIVGYTALMQRDEKQALNARSRHKEAVESAAASHGGEIVQYYGDGVLLLFSSALEAVGAATEMQRALRSEPIIDVRIGLHLGDVIIDSGSVYGDCVNLASRIESVAVAGSVMMSDKVVEELANQPSLDFKSYGQFDFKNVGRPIGVYALMDPGVVVPAESQVKSEKAKKRSRSIAIFPFVEQGGASTDYFADGVTDEIVNGLTKVDGLAVMSETTTQAILQSEDVLAEGRKVGVAQFLEGKVRRAGERVRVSVKLTDTTDGLQIWSETYDRNLDDIFDVQDEIAKSVISALKVNCNIIHTESVVVEKPTEDLEAYKMYLKGMHHWKKRNPEDAKKAVHLFEKALKLDPGYATAQCALSSCYAFLGSCGEISPTDAYARALQYAMNAVESKPNAGEGQLAMANIKFYHFWDWEGARESLEKAEAMGYNAAALHQSYGLYYAAVGKPAEGVKQMREALKLDPLSIPVLTALGTLLLFNEEYEESIVVFDEILDLEPSFRTAIKYKGIAYVCLNRLDKAIEVLRAYQLMVPNPDRGTNALTIALYLADEHDEAQELINSYIKRLSVAPSIGDEIDLALIYAGIGKYEECVNLMEHVYDKRLSVACMGIIWIMRCPAFKDLWSHPGYKALMKKIGVPAVSEVSPVSTGVHNYTR